MRYLSTPYLGLQSCVNVLILKISTLRSLITQLLDADIMAILKEGAGRRPATLIFPQLLNIAEGREVIQTAKAPEL